MTPSEALREAIRRAGNQNRLAIALGIDRQAVNRWRVVPYKRTLEVERLTGVPRTKLRPDLYPE
jgi:DNA-binding transcriptional regulator YdaS (Cro superfamily)